MSERTWRLLAIAWTLVVALLVAHNLDFWLHGSARVDTDVLTLLPRDPGEAEANAAVQKLADAAAQEVIVLVGAPDWAATQRAADAARRIFAALPDVKLDGGLDANSMARMIDGLAPYRAALLTDGQRAWLAKASGEQLAARALALANQPIGGGLSWRDDPLGLFAEGMLTRGQMTKVQPRDGRLTVDGEGRSWELLRLHRAGPAFRLDGSTTLADAVRAATAAARAQAPDADVIAAGIPLFAEAGATQANREMNTVGWGSLAGVLLLIWLAFRSLRPLLLVALSLLVGCLAGISACALVFDKVHIITLVFGASLVGVAEDFGIHYFASRQDESGSAPHALLRAHAPGLILALITSVLAYAALAIVPFPGLRQMALFSAAGLVAAFLTVFCWFPWLDGKAVRGTRAAHWVAATRARWPRLDNRRGVALLVVLLVVCAIGWMRLRVQDDIRTLQNAPVALRDAQIRVARLLGLPSPAQFILVRGASPDAVLAAEEALKPALAALVADGKLARWNALSDWLPSQARQADNIRLVSSAEHTVWQSLAGPLGLEGAPPTVSPRRLDLAQLDAGPLHDALQRLWLGRLSDGYASVITLSGVGPASLPALRAAVAGHAGVSFVDKPGDISRLLGHYRAAMSWVLVLGFALVLLALWRRFGRRCWRALLPTALACAVALGVLGWSGMPLQLFHLLAIFLVLGMGVDYGIFLLEHPRADAGSAWLAVVVGAASTQLSFGLLALSQTPALRAFGIVMGVGIGVAWLLSPMLCTYDDALAASEHTG